MSVSASAQGVLVRRRPFPYILLALLGALALFAALVAIAVSSSSSTTVGTTARPAALRAVPGSVTGGRFRDPSTHALVTQPVSTPVGSTSIRSTPGPGHK
jgi:hypothetical protein